MSPQIRFFRSMALVAAIGVGLTACGEDTNIVFPDPVPTITANPPTMNLIVGQTQTIIPTVTGLTNTAVNFISTNTAVATVTPAGVVTAVAPGAATIRVQSQAQPTLETGVGVNVSAGTPPPPVDSARVIIQSVTRGGTIFPVDPDSVTDVIDVTMSVTRGNARELRVFAITGTGAGTSTELTQCRQTFGAAAAGVGAQEVAEQTQNIVCSVDTRAFTVGTGANANRGIPTFPNGAFRIRAELRNAAGAVLDAAQTGQYTLANRDFVQGRVVSLVPGTATARATAIGDTGLLWYGNGDLQLQLVPVIFSATGTTSPSFPARAFVSLDGWVAGNRVTTSREVTSLTNGGFVVTFPRATAAANTGSGGVANFNTGPEGTTFTVNTVTVGGQPGPTTAVPGRFVFTDLQSGTALENSILRFDNENPEGGRFFLGPHPAVAAIWVRNGWVNPAYNMFAGKDGEHDAPFRVGGAATGPAGARANTVVPTLPALPNDIIRGVGFDSVRIFAFQTTAAIPNPSTAQVIANGVRFNPANPLVGNRLAQTLTNSDIAVVARGWDRLGNSTDLTLSRNTGAFENTAGNASQTGNLARIGVDTFIPTIASTDTIFPYNPGGNYTVTVRDSLDGIAVTRINRITHACGANQRQCAPAPGTNADTSVAVSAVPGSTGASWVNHPIGATIGGFTRSTAAVTIEAYHRFDARVWDRAGNVSTTISSNTFIRDTNNPLVSNVQLPTDALLSGGTSYNFSARVLDNVDMRRASAGFDFSGGIRLPFELVPLTVFGPSAVVLDSLLTRGVPFVRSLAQVGATGAPPAAPVAYQTPVGARFRVWDHASPLGQFSTQANNIVPNTVDTGRRNWAQGAPAIGGQATYGIHSTEWLASPDRWAVRGQTGTFLNPFTRVLFYARLTNVLDDNGQPVNYLLGPATAIGVQDTGAEGNGRIWTFSVPAIPTELAQSQQAFTIFAVGISPSGDALMSNDGRVYLGAFAP